MREFAKFGTGFWTSSAIQPMSDGGKLLAAYLISGPHSNQAGVFRLPLGYVQEDLNWSRERVSEGFAELSGKGFAYRCETTSWVVITKALKHTPPENPNQAKHVRALIEQLPPEACIRTKVAQCVSVEWPDAPPDLIESLNEPLVNPSATLSEQREGEGDKKEKEIERERRREKRDADPEDRNLAGLMFAAIRKLVPKAKEPNLDAWANDIRLMREQDHRPREDIQALFEWSNRDSFWGAVILSPRNLREKWTQLEAKRGRQGDVKHGNFGKQDYRSGVGADGSF